VRRVPEPPPLCLGRRLSGIAAGVGALALFHFLRRRPEVAEALAGSGPLAGLPRLLSHVTGVIPISLVELLVLAFLARQGVALTRGLAELGRGEDEWGRSLLRGGLRAGQDAGWVLAAFVLLWGVHHARPGLEHRLGVTSAGEVEVGELVALARRAVEVSNRLYVEIHGGEDVGRPTQASDLGTVARELEEGWRRLATDPRMPSMLGVSFGRPKPMLASPALRRFGISGMYIPFTGEALVLRDLPGATLPRAAAHEMAHQRGIAGESDANVLAFLVTRQASDPVVRYSGYLFLQAQLMGALARLDRERVAELIRLRHPGVQRDLEAQARYWEVARGWTRSVGVALNDAMLRAHGVAEGVASYQGSVWVLIALAREEGPEVLFPPG
jgi:hypothetical protein